MLRFLHPHAVLSAPFLSLAVTLSLVGVSSASHAESCESIQAVIKAKIESKNAGKRLPVYELQTVDKDQTVSGRIVGSCDHGSKRIVYQVGAKPSVTDKPVRVKKSKKKPL